MTLFIGLIGVLLAWPSAAQDPYVRADGTWISIDGEVKSVDPNSFVLDYGDGMITVEMDDGDRDADAYKLLPADMVTVFGRIDADFFERKTIEASSVHVEKLGTTFYASAVDEEDAWIPFVSVSDPIMVSSTVIQGIVTDVNVSEFTIDSDTRTITVDIGPLEYNPLDDEGYQQIDIGDRVWVSGSIDFSLFEGQEFLADSVVILDDREVTGD